jgi:DNA polymerase/3'-5' exonuclease PolX
MSTHTKIKAVVRPKIKATDTDTGIDDLLSFPMYDLRKSAGLQSLDYVNPVNTGIIDVLDKLIKHTLSLKAAASGKDKSTHQRRIGSFIRGRDAIKDYKQKITSGSQAQKDIDGVGKGIATRIQEYINTGALHELADSVSPEARTIMELTSITGIGEVKALSLMNDHNVTSVNDLVKKYKDGELKIARNQLTHHIAVGIEFYHDLQQRMSWAEADQIAQVIKGKIHDWDPTLKVEVCGSYRRKKPTCGDLDVLITHPSVTTDEDLMEASPLPDIVNVLEKANILVGHLTTKGHTKYMGVCKGPSGTGRRIDIRFVNHSSFGAAMLYFTGSGKFNKIMRYHANTRGYTLNEYGLYRFVNNVKGEMVEAITEKDIFRILGFVYLGPTEREF